MLRKCCECHLSQKQCIPTVQHVNKTVDYVCPRCFKRLQYEQFLYEYRQETETETHAN